jgi:hypothetical protein
VNPVFYQSSDIRLTPCDRATANPKWARIKSDANALQPGGPGNREQLQDLAQPEQTVTLVQNVLMLDFLHDR